MSLIKCLICGREFENYISLSLHLRTHNISSKEYYDKYFKIKNNNCLTCGKETKFSDINRGYRKFCSNRCSKLSEETQEKFEETCLDRYGNKNLNKVESIKEKINNTKKLKSKENPNYLKNIRLKRTENILKKRLPVIKKFLNNIDLEIISNYKHTQEDIKVRCLKCGTIFITKHFKLLYEYGKCPTCYPYIYNCSKVEKELIKFLKSLDLIFTEKDRNILNGKELDIYIPSKNIAIEFDGLYWHSELFKDKRYHLNKTEECLNKNIQLIHIFEDEWVFKQDIVKSRLKQILGINNSERIHTKEYEIKEIDSKIKNEFLNKYHIQGEDRSLIKLGAFYNDELMSVMTLSKNIKSIYKLSRFCSNDNYHIPGIAGKLLLYFKNNYQWNEIYSYTDRRWSEGNLYYKIGFELDSITKLNYWYIKRLDRINRFNLGKRLKKGYHKIWDCGYYKFKIINREELNKYD